MLDINFKNEEILAPPIIGTSKSIERIRDLIDQTAGTGLNVLITGKSGVGKEIVAQNLYYKSERKNKPFIKVNCAALPEGLLESELFGFERGAFTGAERKRRGKFDLAHQGVIFLDEIGDMPRSLQAKLLRVLQSGEFSPLGSEKEVRSDAWVIAATNQELEKKVKEGLFREDLYYRFNTIKIHIPPLRNRPEDIPVLIDYYIKKYASQFDGKQISKPDFFAMERLMNYSWPGNVRELQNILKNCMVIGNWEEIIDDLYLENRSVSTSRSEEQVLEGSSIVDVFLDYKGEYYSDCASFSLNKIRKKATDRIEKEVISFVLDKTDWNRTKANKILKISYKTLLCKIIDLDIKR
jgi:two-component system response regulator AtoC